MTRLRLIILGAILVAALLGLWAIRQRDEKTGAAKVTQAVEQQRTERVAGARADERTAAVVSDPISRRVARADDLSTQAVKARSRICAMRSTPSRLLLPALLLLPLLSTACATRSTPASLARTERPALPPLAADLTRTEQLTPLTAKASGEVVTIDRGILAEIVERFAEAIGAIAGQRPRGRRDTGAALHRCGHRQRYRSGGLPLMPRHPIAGLISGTAVSLPVWALIGLILLML